jgi:hypothetical protein
MRRRAMTKWEYRIVRARYDWVFLDATEQDPLFPRFLEATRILIRWDMLEDPHRLSASELSHAENESVAAHVILKDMISNRKVRRLEAVMEECGTAGWELVTVVKRAEGIYHHYFRRPLTTRKKSVPAKKSAGKAAPSRKKTATKAAKKTAKKRS